MKFFLGPQGVYLAKGKNAQIILRDSTRLSSREPYLAEIGKLDSVTEEDVDKFRRDTTGKPHIPLTEVGEEGRILEPIHRIFSNNLANFQAANSLAERFCALCLERVSHFEKGE